MNARSVGTTSGDGRVHGWTIAAATLTAIAAMTVHPSAGGGDIQSALRDIARAGPASAAVHGLLMATSAALLFGFLGLARRLQQRSLAAAGLVVWSIGTAAMFCAMAASGFIVPMIATAYATATPGQFESVRAVLVFGSVFNQAWAIIGTVFQSAAIAAWSLALFRHGGAARLIGWFGLIAGAASGVAVVAGLLRLDVHGMLLVVLIQGVWSLAVAVQLVRGRI